MTSIYWSRLSGHLVRVVLLAQVYVMYVYIVLEGSLLCLQISRSTNRFIPINKSKPVHRTSDVVADEVLPSTPL